MQKQREVVTLPDGKELIFETGKIARQAGGAVVVKLGETIVFTAATASPLPLEDVDFLPLKVDFQEKFFSAGKTLGGFIKREGRPTEKEILISRLIDRPLRPLFPEGYYHDVQVLSYVWSYDGVNPTEPIAICSASAALVISDIPLTKPIAAVRVGLVNGQLVINPTIKEMASSSLDLMLAGTADAILMIEGYADFLSDEEILQAIDTGHRAIALIANALAAWGKKIGKQKNLKHLRLPPEELLTKANDHLSPKLDPIISIVEKQKRDEGIGGLESEFIEKFESEFSKLELKKAFKKIVAKKMRNMILKENKRPDGRTSTDIRMIDVEHGLLPRAHGSCLFTRGETQTLAVCTLGGENMAQRYETLDGEGLAKFYLQYFFPPFSVGEVGRTGAPGRRELGHGKLAERALQAALPDQEHFPYVIRLESNITESNGSSSMASVCGGCLSMMDAGVPIKKPVSGIAMGLILEEDQVQILSDILGIEDALGDMDFKVAGDAESITAFQMDIKVEGITIDIMRKALAQAKSGRIHILNKMLEALPKHKNDLSLFAPRIETIKINPSKIGSVIGPGGKQIRSIIEETGVQIDIADNGVVSLASNNPSSMKKAKQIIEGIVGEVEIGKIYLGKVTSVVPFGVFVEILPKKEGLCHISQLSEGISDIFKFISVGEDLSVKVTNINERGQIQLSHKAAQSKSKS